MKLIFGANGKVGRAVATELVQSGHEDVRLFVRDLDLARSRFEDRVEYAVGDLDQRATVRAAMAGTTHVFLCSPVHPEQVRLHGNVIEAAQDLAEPYVVKLSGLATALDSYVDSGRWHAESEYVLARSGLDFTCLHPNFFMQNLVAQFDQVRSSGVLAGGVNAAPIAMIDVSDIASIVARLFEDPSLGRSQTIPLTTRRAISYPELAEEMSKAWSREIVFRPLQAEQIEANLKRSGQPDWHIDILLQFNRAFNEGLGSKIDDAASKILGRAPKDISDHF